MNLSYKNKKILIMGLGLHGGGLAVANWFIKQGAKVRITDLKSRDELLPSLRKLHSGRVGLTLGKHQKADFLWADIVVQNPGVPRESSYLQIARDHGAKIENEATLFFKTVGRENIIGITGTRGKSTVANLIWQLLKQKNPATLIAGNIAVNPMFKIVDNVGGRTSHIVLELSSWHLENLGEQGISPHLAVITNILPDHLNRYSSLGEYTKAKANIFKYQRPSDLVILNLDNPITKKLGKQVVSQRFWFSKKYFAGQNGCFIKSGWIIFCQNGTEKRVLKVSKIKLPGIHNLENVLAAVTVAMIMKVPVAKATRVVKGARGLPHRLELVCEVKGVQYINDTTATTPDATMAALRTLSQKSKIILIAGGADKNIPQAKFDELAREIKKTCKAVILFQGQGSEKIEKALIRIVKVKSQPSSRAQVEGKSKVKSMFDAVAIANANAKSGDIVLLSPACASFGLFVNEFDRGDQFRKLVNKK